MVRREVAPGLADGQPLLELDVGLAEVRDADGEAALRVLDEARLVCVGPARRHGEVDARGEGARAAARRVHCISVVVAPAHVDVEGVDDVRRGLM